MAACGRLPRPMWGQTCGLAPYSTAPQACPSIFSTRSCSLGAPSWLDGREPPLRQQQRQWAEQRRQRARRRHILLAAASQADNEGSALASEFQRMINEQGVPELLRDRRPTHLMSPIACITAQMDALQRNDWPDRDAGVQTAFMFAKSEEASDPLAKAAALPKRVRSWGAREEYLAFPDFSNMLHSPPYLVLLNCDSWQPASQLVFPSSRHSNKAVLAVVVEAAAAGAGAAGAGQQQQQQQQQQPKRQVFTFCLERLTQGPYKNCWLTVGVRVGDYANV